MHWHMIVLRIFIFVEVTLVIGVEPHFVFYHFFYHFTLFYFLCRGDFFLYGPIERLN